MATDGPDPKPCDPDIFKKGKGICVIDGSSNAVENWVKKIAQEANAKVDWHYSGGRANVLHLGNKTSRQRVLVAIDKFKDQLNGTILSVGKPALFRRGVDEVPKGTRVIS